MKLPVATFCLLLAGLLPCRAIIFWNLDNSANQSDPGTGAHWASVGKVITSDNTSLSGSAIYLGNRYLLTADHVTMATNTFSHVTFDGTNFFEIDATFQAGSRNLGKQVAAGVDLAVFRLSLEPVGIPSVNLLSSTNEAFGSAATMVGWGVGRDPSAPLLSTNVPWGDATTSAQRWGLNTPRDATNISYSGYTMDVLRTVLGGNGAAFAPDGLGDAEGAAAVYDSGSALFQEIGSVWYLIGVTTAVETGGASIYGDDKLSGLGRGDVNIFARVSAYDSDIIALVPEPRISPLLALAAAVAFIFHRRRTHRAAEPKS